MRKQISKRKLSMILAVLVIVIAELIYLNIMVGKVYQVDNDIQVKINSTPVIENGEMNLNFQNKSDDVDMVVRVILEDWNEADDKMTEEIKIFESNIINNGVAIENCEVTDLELESGLYKARAEYDLYIDGIKIENAASNSLMVSIN